MQIILVKFDYNPENVVFWQIRITVVFLQIQDRYQHPVQRQATTLATIQDRIINNSLRPLDSLYHGCVLTVALIC